LVGRFVWALSDSSVPLGTAEEIYPVRNARGRFVNALDPCMPGADEQEGDQA
jgi:hypothetical protein